ncbi:Ankyrin repeat-containing domain [Phytophthora cactorum]|nr:Ankyrin repeat-containing domain [Phytophthora cactorum]
MAARPVPVPQLPRGVFHGFLADEVEQILPDLVEEDADGWKSLNYVGIVPTCWGYPSAADDAEAVASYLDRAWPLDALQGDEEAVKRRYELVQECVSSGGKCPLGFGAKTVSKVVTRNAKDVKHLRTIMFQGQHYDVTDSSLFHPDGGQFAHFVGHDVTYALAVQSIRMQDLDVTPERAYTFEEQLLLERYRNFFTRELAILEVDGEQEGNGNRMKVVNVHQVIEESDSMAQEECVKYLKKSLEGASVEQVNAVCARTTMTPLHKAVEKHRLDLVEELVRAGADVEARAALYDDETPLEMAHRFHFDDIAAHLASVAVGSS